MVGTSGCPAPHALMMVARRIVIVRVLKNFIRCLLLNLAMWIAASPGYDLVVSNYDVPIALLDHKAAEHLEALSSIYERTGAICADGSAGEVPQISTFSLRSNNVERKDNRTL